MISSATSANAQWPADYYIEEVVLANAQWPADYYMEEVVLANAQWPADYYTEEVVSASAVVELRRTERGAITNQLFNMAEAEKTLFTFYPL